jgi:hypothetical protein
MSRKGYSRLSLSKVHLPFHILGISRHGRRRLLGQIHELGEKIRRPKTRSEVNTEIYVNKRCRSCRDKIPMLLPDATCQTTDESKKADEGGSKSG